MKIFDRMKKFFNSGDEDKISLSRINELFAINGSGEYGSDLSEITYFTCLKVLSESIGKIPIYLLDKDKRRVLEHDTTPILQFSTNHYQTPAQFFTIMEYNRNHYGNAYAFCQRNRNGELEKLIPLDPRYVQIWINNTGEYTNRKYFYFFSDPRTAKSYSLNPEDVIHVRSWITEDNGIVGRSVREILARMLQGSKSSNKFLNELYDKGLLANLYVRYVGDLSLEKQKTFLKRIEEMARENSRKMITLPPGYELIPLDLKLTDSQFLQIKQYTALQIASAFAIKPNFLNDYSKSSYANATAQNLSFYVDSLLPIITYYEQEMNRKLLTQEELKSGLHFKFNVGVLLRNDPTAQADIIQKLIQSGVYSINEARSLLDREPCENGDRHLCNGSYVSLEDLGIAYRDKQKGGDKSAKNQEPSERDGGTLH